MKEPVNSLLVKVETDNKPLTIFGNVVTLKDQWSKTSKLKYSDRLGQQIEAIKNLPEERTLIAGDFNLRLGWPQKLGAHKRIGELASSRSLAWPSEKTFDTVQHVLHTNDLNVDLQYDTSVKYGEKQSTGLSDHPFVKISASPA